MGRGDLTVPVVESWTILSMAAGATERVTVGPFVLNVMNRHPAVVARMASTLQIASGGRLVLGIGIGGAPEGARGLRHRLPGGARARRAPRGGRRGHPCAVDRRTGDARLAVLSAGRGIRPPGPGPAAADHHRRRDAGRGAPGRPDRRRLVGVRRQLRGEPAALSRVARREPAGGARTSASSSGSRATGWATSRSPTRRGSRRRARPGSAGRRPAPTARSCWPGRPHDVDALVEATGRW